MTLFVIGLVVILVVLASVMSLVREKTIWRLLQLLGAACLVLVVLTHVAEALHALPNMGLGMPYSAGHYLDLVSAVVGLALLSLGLFASVLLRRTNSK